MKREFRSVLVWFAAAVLSACGGGMGRGDPNASAATAKVMHGTVKAVSMGAITVNGVVLSTSSARVTIDGQPASAGDVKAGEVVTVKGTADDRTGAAAEVEVEHALEGQVEAKGADFVVVGGERIQVDDSTRFGPEHPNGLDSVAAGQVIRISGSPIAGVAGAADDHGVRASRIDLSPRSGGDPSDDAGLEVKGFVSSIDTGSRTFQLRVSPDAAGYYLVEAAALPAGLADGAFVEVVTTVAPAPGTPPVLATLIASEIGVEDRIPAAGSELELEGYVTSISGTRFVVSGITVATSASTAFALGTAADLAVGVEVEVHGSVDASGVLRASRIVFEAGARITAAVESLTPTDLVLLGVPVQLPSWLRDDLSVPLAVGVRVEVRGVPTADGAGLVASRIGDPQSGGGGSRVFLRAVVSAKAADNVTVLGFTVSLAGASLQGADGSAAPSVAAFLAGVEPGHTVLQVRASSAADVNTVTKVWIADEVEIEGKD